MIVKVPFVWKNDAGVVDLCVRDGLNDKSYTSDKFHFFLLMRLSTSRFVLRVAVKTDPDLGPGQQNILKEYIQFLSSIS